ncbi:MAG TPA: calcium/proton exchanger [Anaerolineales bacterium]|nr:calcium/proton exchanger [Anaerolineales bacterium]
MRVLNFLRKEPVAILFLAIPLVFLAEIKHWNPIVVFAISALGVIPAAHYIGKSTEALAHYTGPRIGGLLNATLGNAAELIIAIFAIRENLLQLVKASLTGSILGNLLLVLGMSMIYGGFKNGIQSFNRQQASNNAILLALVVVTLVLPSFFSNYIGPEGSLKVEALSLGVAGIMILLYVLGLIFSFKMHQGPLITSGGEESGSLETPGWSVRRAILVLLLSTAAVAYLSEVLVGAVGPVVTDLGISEFFLGIILIPLIGNVAEHLVAVQVAGQNKMDLSVEIAVSSSLQIALFVAPMLVFVSLLMGNPLTLIFHEFELIALIAGVMIAALVSADGESNWLEGMELLAVYAILALVFFLLPV